MCSIMCYAGKDISKEQMQELLLRTEMRGPDANEVVETEFGYLGFARLAIMGLTFQGGKTDIKKELPPSYRVLCSW